jgi:prepilin-type N-terminal cleavage/methylation domain-containing protein
MRNRRGFSLAEVMIAIVVVSVIAGAMTKVLLNQNRFFDQQQNLRTARSIARNSMNIMLADLRMAQDSGSVDSASTDGKAMRVLVPYRYGIVCGTSGNITTVSMLPADSGTIATSVYAGFAYRNASGRYTYVFPNNPTGTDLPAASGSSATCTGTAAGQAQLSCVSLTGRSTSILDLSNSGPSGAPALAPVFFFEKVTYSFRSSGYYAGSYGLWRNVMNGRNEEIMAPFENTSMFRYYQDGDDTARTTVPALADIRGLDIILSAKSPRSTSNGSTSPSKMVTSVFFKNVRAY